MKSTLKIAVWVISFLFLFQGCLKDNISPVINVSIGNSALELKYFEENSDYINSEQMPSVIKPEELYGNLTNYLVVDIRPQDEYMAGHVPGAFNVRNDSLLQFLLNKNIQNYQKVVLVDADGQSSSYYTCLLRLYGFNNIYNLVFGMAEWNKSFSAIWENHLTIVFPGYKGFYNHTFPYPDMSPLPSISFKNSAGDLQDKIKDRIASLIKEGFIHYQNYVYVSDLLDSTSTYYIACYGRDSLYYHDKESTTGSGHFKNTVLYHPAYDIKSIFHLQTFPNDKKILIYSYSGHLSAYLEAYLRALGYDATSLMYGGCDMFYYFYSMHPTLFYPLVFFTSDIKNYPYTTGTNP